MVGRFIRLLSCIWRSLVERIIGDTFTLAVPLLVVGSSFVLHELLHKFTAQRFGFWSEFRANYVTLGLSILFAYVVHIVFAAPGATMIYGPNITKRQNGIISAAGPLLNLALGGLYLLLYADAVAADAPRGLA